jgi:hypothetical protein
MVLGDLGAVDADIAARRIDDYQSENTDDELTTGLHSLLRNRKSAVEVQC